MAMEMRSAHGGLQSGVNAYGVNEFQCEVTIHKKGEHNGREEDGSNNKEVGKGNC